MSNDNTSSLLNGENKSLLIQKIIILPSAKIFIELLGVAVPGFA